MGPAVEVKGLKKTFVSGWLRRRRKEALKGVDLIVPERVFWGILGPNGAGKTTLLSILSNLLTPEEGEVRILGMDVRTHAMDLRERINLSSGHANFLWSMTVRENLQYYAMLYGLPRKKRRQKVEDLLRLLDFGDFAHVRFDELSTGTKQKLSLAKADHLTEFVPLAPVDPIAFGKVLDFYNRHQSISANSRLVMRKNRPPATKTARETTARIAQIPMLGICMRKRQSR